MIQQVIKDLGGTIETYFSDRRPVTCTVTLYTGDGTAKVSAASATVDAVSTTASSAVAAAATTVALADASSIVAGRRYMLGVLASTAPMEVVTVKSLSASTATLFVPTVYAHNSGDAFRGCRVSYSVTAGAADVLWWDGFADFDADTGDTITEAVDCILRKIPTYLIDKTDVLTVFPKGQKMLDAELELQRALLDARDHFLRDFGGKFRAMAAIGADHFKRPAALRFWLDRRYAFGQEWSEQFDVMQKDYEKEIAKLQASVPVDADQDGTTTGEDDGGITMGRLERA